MLMLMEVSISSSNKKNMQQNYIKRILFLGNDKDSKK